MLDGQPPDEQSHAFVWCLLCIRLPLAAASVVWCDLWRATKALCTNGRETLELKNLSLSAVRLI